MASISEMIDTQKDYLNRLGRYVSSTVTDYVSLTLYNEKVTLFKGPLCVYTCELVQRLAGYCIEVPR